MVIGAIFAGGSGSRMNCGETPKQYLPLGGKPVIAHTAAKFFANPALEKILILCPAPWVDATRAMMTEHFGETDRITVLAGGQDRNGTLIRALDYIQEQFGLFDETVIVTHDAVRPFVTQRIIDENIAAAEAYGACGTYIPACDTIAESPEGETVTFIPERARMYQTQTPQSFKAKRLKALLAALSGEEQAKLTDACMIYTLKGEPVRIVRGEVYNLKITYPVDLPVAEALLQAGVGQD